MEIFFVYALVFIFFLLTGLFTVGVLAHRPYTEPPQAATTARRAPAGGIAQEYTPSKKERKIAYGLLALFFLLLCIGTLWQRRKK